MQAEQGYYFVGSKYNQLLKQKFQELVGDEKPRPQVVEVIMGRKLEVKYIISTWPVRYKDTFEVVNCNTGLGFSTVNATVEVRFCIRLALIPVNLASYKF